MVNKENIKCITKTYVGPFWENYLVYLHFDTTNLNIYDLRVMNKSLIISHEEEKLIQYEYYVRNKIRHSNIIFILSAFLDSDYLYYVFEYAPVNLVNFLEVRVTFSKNIAKFYIAEIILGIQHIHSKDHTFGIICPKNVLLSEKGHVKLRYDFLNAIEDRIEGFIFSYIEFTSPEYIFEGKITKATSYWGIGILLYYMLTGYTPFSVKESYEETIEKVKYLNPPFPSYFDEDTKDLLLKLLEKNPEKRLQDKSIRKHPFFKGLDWEDLENHNIQPPFLFDNLSNVELQSAELNKLYTTEYYPGQCDDYGSLFKYFGRADAENPYF